MKKLFLIWLLALPNIGLTQLSPPREKMDLNLQYKKYTSQPEIRTGPVVMVGGAAFILAGLLTTPTMEGSSTKRNPFYKQVRNLPILTGSIVLTFGLAITISGN